MTDDNPYLAAERQILGDIYTSTHLMDNLEILCDGFGSRFGGTEGERQAADFIVAQMQAYGLGGVHLEPVDYVGWTRGEARLTIVSPTQRDLPCISLPHSPPADLEAAIVDLGDGAPADFDRRADEIAGRIVMTTSVVSPKGARRWIHRGEKYQRCVLAGAVGFLFVNHYPGYGPATGGVGRNGPGPIPGFSVSYEDGAYLRRLIRRQGEVRLRLWSTDRTAPMVSWNVIGDLPGGQSPDQLVILGCHYDGHDIAQGAGDPASGVVALLEAARVLACYAPPLRCTLRFILWGVEEIGLLGSRAYVAAHEDELSRVRFYLNLDGAGSAGNNRDVVLNEWPALEPLFRRWGDQMAQPYAVGQSVMAFSDHFPFFMAGVPTGGVQSAEQSLAGRGYGHTRHDTVDKVALADLRQAAALAARLALRVADAPDWPVERRPEEAVLALLDSPEYREEQAFRQRVDAFYRAG